MLKLTLQSGIVFSLICTVLAVAFGQSLEPVNSPRDLNHDREEAKFHAKTQHIGTAKSKACDVNNIYMNLHKELVRAERSLAGSIENSPSKPMNERNTSSALVKLSSKYSHALNDCAPTFAKLLSDAGWLKVKVGMDFFKARKLVIIAHELAPKSTRLTLRAAIVHYNSSSRMPKTSKAELDATKDLAMKVIKNNPNNPMANYLLGLVATTRGNTRGYISHMQKFVDNFNAIDMSLLRYKKNRAMDIKRFVMSRLAALKKH